MNKYQFTASLLIASLAAVLPATGANAYVLIGTKWPSGSQQYENNATSAYVSSATAAISSWNSSTQLNLQGSSSAQPLRLFVVNYGAAGYDGVTLITVNALTGYFYKADVTLNTHYASSFPTNRKRAVWVHEIGHGVGLGHVSSGKQLMNSCASCVYSSYGYYTPQSDDIAGANFLY